MLHKGIYPYEYMDTFQKFNEGCLPSKEAFFSSLTNETVSDDDYAHCQNVWKSFNLKTLGEYHDLYVTSDVILLADVFQNFRQLCLNFYKLDPCHCYTAPGLAWQACLYMSRVKLELFTDLDMHLFVERGIRGGISMISHRFSSANNKYLDSYDENKPSKYILYLDANNLYGWAMSQPLPTHGFEWITQPIDFMEIPDESDIGYILEVDMDYPQNLHNLHNDYPLAPETLNVTNDMLSPYCKEIAQEHNLNTNSYISKILMYNFHYKYIKSKYDTNAKLLFTDTDSLCYEIVTQDVYEDMQKDLHFFDTSDYPQTHPLYCEINKKVLGKMKDELSSSLALEFVGLKPKMYSLKSAEMEKKTAKGVSKIIIQQQIRHRDYKETLLYRRRGLAKAKKIASHNHIVQTVAYQKSTLSPFDSKRYILQDGINTLAYGHFKI
ncbi:uncharacterized protein TNCV_4286611 [Trichonephila clavipes]|nr:uncharacterized protein TNCV_4286611 [Trichonephila clavipes]